MRTTSKFLALIGVILITVFLVDRWKSDSPRISPAVFEEKRVANTPSAPSARDPLSAADWLEKFQNSAVADRAGLMHGVLAISDETLRNQIATALAGEWMTTDLDGYLAFLDSLLASEGLSSETMKRFSVALMRSFETAVGKTPLKGKIRYVAEVIVDYLIANNLGGTESWAREFLVGLDLETALAKLAPAMVADSPQQALAIFSSIKAVLPRLTAASDLGTALAKRDPANALEWANSIGAHSERTMAMASVTTVISGADPTRAAASLKSFMEKIQDEYTQRREQDRQQAGVKAADEFQTPELYEEYLEANGNVLMQPDTPEADYLLKASEQIGFQLAKTDPLGALAWAESLAVKIAQAHAISGALSGWSTTAPQQAVDHYLRNYGYDTAMPLYLFENWASQDPDTAAAAIQDLDNAGQKSSAIQGVTNGWLDSENNLVGLIEWVAQLPPGTDRDKANLAIIAQTSDANPSTAWELVLQLSDPAARRRAANDVFALLAVENPAPARSVLDAYQAPAEEIEALRRILALAESPN